MIERLTYITDLFAMFYMYNKLMGEKIKADIITVLFFLGDIVVLMLINEYQAPRAISILMYVITFVYLMVEFKVSIVEAIKKYILGLVVMSLFQFVVSTVIYLVFDGVLKNEVNIFLINLIVLLLMLIMFQSGIIEKLVRQVVDFKNYRFMVAILVTICLAIFVLFKSEGNIRLTYFLEISAFAGLVVYDAALWYREQTKIEMEKRELQMQKVYGNVFADLIADIRRKQHNFDNHIHALSSMYLSVSTLEELAEKQQEYKSQIVSDNKYNKLINQKSSPVISGFLYHKLVAAEESNVNINYHIVIEEVKCRLSQYEMVEILGVIFDNAVEAVEKLSRENRTVDFEMIEYQDRIVIKTENICEKLRAEQIGQFFKEGYSTKGDNRGLGLPEIKKIMERCGGRIYTEIVKRENAEWFSLKLEIDK